ncbi:MAG: MoaD/ThiS family protein [Pirellulales bacterium]|nr:MoaD/ThiS family protein [Pirellulales bacterium]
MTITLKLFAAARELAGNDTFQLEIPAESTVADFAVWLSHQMPQLAKPLPHCRWSVNQAYALPDQIIPPRAEVALIPPVSGG